MRAKLISDENVYSSTVDTIGLNESGFPAMFLRSWE